MEQWKSWPFLVASMLLLSSCISKPETSVFEWRLESDVKQGKSVEGMWLGKAVDYSREKIQSNPERSVWRFTHVSKGCAFDYVTDREGRGIAYQFVGEPGTCVYEGKFSGW